VERSEAAHWRGQGVGVMVRRWLLPLMVALSGCMHRSPEERMLDAFSNDKSDRLFFPDGEPQYLRFADERTAWALRRIERGGRYRIAPAGASLLCPGVPDEGLHGYLIAARVDTVMGDSAIAGLMMDCIRDPYICPSGQQSCVSMNSGVIRIMTDYLLTRRNGKWTVAKPVSGGIAIPM
jgi:hypothetical protein